MYAALFDLLYAHILWFFLILLDNEKSSVFSFDMQAQRQAGVLLVSLRVLFRKQNKEDHPFHRLGFCPIWATLVVGEKKMPMNF